MAIMYDQFQLANSTRVKPYVGSALPELYKVAEDRQMKYDTALQYEDALDQYLKSSSAWFKDQPLLNQLKGEYRKRIEERAGKGDYENMWRDTMMDSRDFVTRYKPIAENQLRVQQYQKALDENKDINATKKELLWRASIAKSPGLTIDPTTGAVSNTFRGINPAKDVDLTKEVDQMIKDYNAVVRGSKIDRISTGENAGKYILTTGSKTKTLTHKELMSLVADGIGIKPEVQAYLDQEEQLAPYTIRGFDVASDEQIDAHMRNVRTAATREPYERYLAAGMSPKEAFARIVGEQRRNQVIDKALAYSRKGVIDERETLFEIEETEEGKTAGRKKIEDSNPIITTPIIIPAPGSELNTPGKTNDRVQQLTDSITTLQRDMRVWMQPSDDGKISAIQQKGESWGRFENGVWKDYSAEMRHRTAMMDQAAKQRADILNHDSTLRSLAGITPAAHEIADKKAKEAVEDYKKTKNAPRINSPNRVFYTPEGREDLIYENTYAAALKETQGGESAWNRYKNLKEKDGENQSRLIGASTFGSKEITKQLTTVFKNLGLNMDPDGVQFGTLGLRWGSGPNAGRLMSAEEYKAVVGDVREDPLWTIEGDGIYVYYKVGTGKIDSKGEYQGQDVLVKMPAPAGTEQFLIRDLALSAPRTGETKESALKRNAAYLGLSTTLSRMLEQARGTGGVVNYPVGTDAQGRPISIELKDISKGLHEGNYTDPSIQLHLRYIGADGTDHLQIVNGLDHAVRSIMTNLENMYRTQEKAQK